MSNEMNKATE